MIAITVLDILVEQLGVKNKHDTAFCDEELKFGTVIEEPMKSKTGYIIDHDHVIQGAILCFSPAVWPQNKNL